MRAALCQTNIIFEDKQANLSKAERFIEQAAQKGADIVLFPEMSLTGFSMNTDKTKENGETVKNFSALSKKHGIACGFGWVKAVEDKAQNIYTILDKNGDIIAEYAKIHPFSYAGEDKFFIPGTKDCTFEAFGMKIGIAICYDLRFPNMFGGEYDLMIVPANWPQARREHWSALLKARAIENQAYFIGINCVGEINGLNYSGDTAVYGPNGDRLNILADKEGIVFADIDKKTVDDVRKTFPTRTDRRFDI